jgi:hypothetical protein
MSGEISLTVISGSVFQYDVSLPITALYGVYYRLMGAGSWTYGFTASGWSGRFDVSEFGSGTFQVYVTGVDGTGTPIGPPSNMLTITQ